jgi:hypothetical protein
MAGRIPPTKAEITAAIKAYLGKHDGIACEYKQDDDCYELTDANGKGAIVGPGWQCNDEGLFNELREILMAQRESTSPPGPARGTNLAVRGTTGINTSQPPMNAAQAIQTMQAGKGLTYQVNKKPAPTATMALMAATDAKVNLTEVASVLTDELASSTIRATAKNGRSVDATVSIRKADFINLLAWKEVDEQEKLKNPILDDSDPMNIALPNGFPRIKPDAMVMIRVKTKESNLIEKRRAIVHIYITAMQQWIFQQRQCQTKAKRNAIIQLLTSSGNPTEVMDEDELADEERERQMVAEAA